jgi:hypothetical protein
MREISAPVQMGGTAALIPGVHTTEGAMEADGPPAAPRMGGLGLGGLRGRSGGDDAEVPPTPRGRPDEPLPTPRGGGGLGAIPRVEEPLPTPRGRPAPDEAAREGDARSSKKARDDEAGADADTIPVAGGAHGPPGGAELYAYPEWENLSMFDSDDLLEEGAFALLVFSETGAAERVVLWVGNDSQLSYERDSDILEVGREFTAAKGCPDAPVTLVFQGEEEDESFWKYFVNG